MMLGKGKPFHNRKFLILYCKYLNKIGRKMINIGNNLQRSSQKQLVQAVVEYHKKKGTWPQINHIYKEMRG